MANKLYTVFIDFTKDAFPGVEADKVKFKEQMEGLTLSEALELAANAKVAGYKAVIKVQP